jgi:hypothetical protein
MMSVLLIFQLFSSLHAFSVDKKPFAIKFKDEISNYSIMSVFVLPEEVVRLEIIEKVKSGKFSFEMSTGARIAGDNTTLRWRSPAEKGLYTMRIVSPAQTDTMILNVFVMVPYSELKDEYLNGYRIGKYPTTPLKQLAIYRPPKGFIEVTRENIDTYLSPHFTLRQFICKQVGNYPKYIVLRERLLLKLELILEKVNEKGYNCETFHVMSGYRTPYYNQAIKDVRYSRHVWGGAADIFIDENPKDGMMDDLNKDGVIDYRDAKILYDLVDDMHGKPWYEKFIGGLGRYRKTSNHGPFVHVDVRGFHARWGQ